MKRGTENYHIERIWRIFLAHGCKRVLDAGCGTGWFGRYTPDDSVEVFGIDSDPTKLGEAKTHETITEGDVRNLPFADRFFDGVVALHVIESVLESLRVMKEFNRVLRMGGVLVAESPSLCGDHFWSDYTHVRPHTRESFMGMTEDSGFEVLSCRYLGNGIPMPLLGKLGLFSLAAKMRTFVGRFYKRGRGNTFLVAKKVVEGA